MSKELKAIRGQLRQIAKEMMPEVLASELLLKLQEEQKARLNELAKMVVDRLNEMDDRQKAVQSYIMREAANATTPQFSQADEGPKDA